MSESELAMLRDKEAIREVIYRYARGVDRMDADLTRSVWHDDGTAQYFGFFEGTGHAWVDWCWKVHQRMEAHSHQMTNILIELDGERASSETYSIVTLRTVPDADGKRQHIDVRGRYLDRWSKRAGRWAIDHRVHVMDLQTIDGVPTSGNEQSRRGRDDLSYGLLSR